MPKFKAFVENLDDVEEPFRPYYVETKDGEGDTIFKLNVEGIERHPDTLKLKNALDRQKAKVGELKSELEEATARLEDLPDDFDPEEYQRLRDAGGKAPNEEEIVERVTARLEKKHRIETDKLTAERDDLLSEVERRERKDALDTALANAGVTDPVYRKAARALLSSKIKVEKVDGEYIATAEDEDLGTVPAAEFVKDWAETDEGKAFVGARDNSGGGAGGGKKDPPKASEFTAENFNLTKFVALKKSNPAEAKRIAIACGKPEYARDL